ncbi:MAG: ATP synthase F1 subunit gamma [Ferrimicrobium sp.]
MAGGQERALRGRIRSVNSTKKITKAMELIAASRIVKAIGRIGAARLYYREVSELTRELRLASPSLSTPLIVGDPTLPSAIVVVTADRGLCGSYNSSVLRAFEQAQGAHEGEMEVTAIGRKGESYLGFRGYRIAFQFNQVTHLPTLEQAHRILDPLLDRVDRGEIGAISVLSVRFYSIATQRMEHTKLVPLPEDAFAVDGGAPVARVDFEAEPSLEAVTERTIREMIFAQFFGLLLEASAAQHAAQQRAMKSATDNADELVTTLTRAMNRVRQDAITTEITEIVGGAEALNAAAAKLQESER